MSGGERAGTCQPTLTIDLTSAGLILGIGLLVATSCGVRVAWALMTVGNGMLLAFVFGEASVNPSAQTIGVFILLSVALACLLLQTSQRFEHRRLRLVIE